jgi:hypothetical protein
MTKYCWIEIATIAVLLITGIIGCSDETSDNENIRTNSSRKEVALTTGTGDKAIEWTITEVRRTDRYDTSDPTIEVVQADSVEIKDEARPSLFMQTTNFFSFSNGYSFKLVDKRGREFQPQTTSGTGSSENGVRIDRFTVPFCLAPKGEKNSDIVKWGDLIIKDPDPTNADLPGHTASLAVFDDEGS